MVDIGLRRRSVESLEASTYDLVQAVGDMNRRFGQLTHVDLAGLVEVWEQAGTEARSHLASEAPSGHGYQGDTVELMSTSEAVQIHGAEHSGSDPATHSHDVGPFGGSG